jgi:ribosome biogenesis ATPase
LAPCIIFIDEIESIAAKKDINQRGTENKILSAIILNMDELMTKIESQTSLKRHVIVLGVTNNPSILEPIIRRAGRFDREISLGMPNEEKRINILKVLCRNLRVDQKFDYKLIANQTSGFVGADLLSLSKEAATNAIKRSLQKFIEKNCELSFDSQKLLKNKSFDINITTNDFELALSKVQPTIKREGFTKSPLTNWHDVG